MRAVGRRVHLFDHVVRTISNRLHRGNAERGSRPPHRPVIADTEFLVNAGGYLTAIARHELSDQLDYKIWSHLEKWFRTMTMRIDRFHSF